MIWKSQMKLLTLDQRNVVEGPEMRSSDKETRPPTAEADPD